MNRFGDLYDYKSEKLYKQMFDTGQEKGHQYPASTSRGNEEKYEANLWHFQAQFIFL